MSDDYLRWVCEAYQGESYGEVLFRELAAKSDDPEINYKWRALEQLELETKLRLRPLVESLGGDTKEAAENEAKGRTLAEEWASKEWNELIKSLDAILPKYVRFFEKLEAAGPESDREVLARVTAHEVAIQEFTRRELDGRAQSSIDPVVQLLDDPPSREV